jgi:outer membrane receptor protein involved in Fe transport
VTITSYRRILAASAAVAVLAGAGHAAAQSRNFNIPAQSATSAIPEFGRQAGVPIIAPAEALRGLRTPALTGQHDVRRALRMLIAGTNLEIADDTRSMITLRVRAAPAQVRETPVVPRRRPAASPPVAAPDANTATVTDVIVTARRREERIIDVPVAVSAFTEERLDDLKIEGGAELLRAIPNVNFSKDNFTGYNFSIRGVGTKVVSATADPAVAVSFNNTALLRNRLFEQEYFDTQRLEVLRGPQGTLYGRNATAGVVNMLPNLPKLGEFSGEIQGEIGNYETQRARGYINIPLGDRFAVRVAGAMTQRDGFDYNTVTQKNVNGRDLWSARLGVLWQPTSNFRANFLWEHFKEEDDRSRTGKQLCTRASAPNTVDYVKPNGQRASTDIWTLWSRSTLTPGCQAKSLFSDDAYGVADSFGSPMVTGMLMLTPFPRGSTMYPDNFMTDEYIDPFNTNNGRQSANLREISTNYDPVFRAENDVFQLNMDLDLTSDLTLYSQTLYMKDKYYGSQDGMRSEPAPGIFRKIAGYSGIYPWWDMRDPGLLDADGKPVEKIRYGFSGKDSAYGAIFCDPQLGCSDHALSVDIARSNSKQFSQEFRLTSAFDGPFNFNLGANYLKFETREEYYALSNLLTIIAMGANVNVHTEATSPYRTCGSNDPTTGTRCMYIDPNPIDKVDGDGHNYYHSLDLSKTESWAAFGEGYLALAQNLRLTLGLRYTHDEKTVTPVPTQMLVSTGVWNGLPNSKTVVSKGFIYEPDETYAYGEWTGRLAVDWKPELPFTNETLIYASYARGYKAGGNNPYGQYVDPDNPSFAQLPRGFKPEFVNAFEVGTKNSLLGGRALLGATAFYYDYKDYQVSQILDRAFHTEGFDSRILGLELEGSWRATDRLRFDATLGYLNTSIAAGAKSIDVMNRTAGNDDWMVVRPWATSPYTCIVPKDVVGRIVALTDGPYNPNATPSQKRGSGFTMRSLCPGGIFGTTSMVSTEGNVNWNPLKDAQGGGRGFYTEVGGNELPNSPHLTFNIGAEYRFQLPAGWDLTLRGDYYRQSESYMRVYNTEYDRLKGWGNANLSLTMDRKGSPLRAQLYVKNVFDDTPITDGFTGPDELGNFTNVFTLDPRIVGLSVRASF